MIITYQILHLWKHWACKWSKGYPCTWLSWQGSCQCCLVNRAVKVCFFWETIDIVDDTFEDVVILIFGIIIGRDLSLMVLSLLQKFFSLLIWSHLQNDSVTAIWLLYILNIVTIVPKKSNLTCIQIGSLLQFWIVCHSTIFRDSWSFWIIHWEDQLTEEDRGICLYDRII